MGETSLPYTSACKGDRFNPKRLGKGSYGMVYKGKIDLINFES